MTPTFTHTTELGQIHTLSTTQVLLTGGVDGSGGKAGCIFQQQCYNSPLPTSSTPSTKNKK